MPWTLPSCLLSSGHTDYMADADEALLSLAKAPLPLLSTLAVLFCSTETSVTLQAAAHATVLWCQYKIHGVNYGVAPGRVGGFVLPGDAHLQHELNIGTQWTYPSGKSGTKEPLFSSWALHCNNVFLIYHRNLRTNWEKFLRYLSCQSKFLQWVYNHHCTRLF